MASINFNDGVKPNPLNFVKPVNNFNSFTTTGYEYARVASGIKVYTGDKNAYRQSQMFGNNMSDMSKRMLPCKVNITGYDDMRVKRRPPARVQLYPPNVFSRDNKKGIAVEKAQKIAPILPVASSTNSALNSSLGAKD